MKTGRLIGSLLFLLCSNFLGAQNHSYLGKTDRFTTRDGLPHNTIRSLYQDETGYLWIGTSNGLCKYDGINFSEIKIPTEEKNHWSQVVEAIYEDKSDRIWFSSRSGLITCLNNYDKSWQVKGELKGASNFVTSFYQDSKGNLWLGTNSGQLGYYTSDSDSICRVKNLNAQIRHIYLDGKDRIWVLADNLKLFDALNFRELALPKDLRQEASDFQIVDLNKNGDILMWNGDSCIQYSMNVGSPQLFGKIHPKKKKLPHSKEFIWLSAEKVLISNNSAHSFDTYVLSEDKNNFEINEMIEDKSGLIWAATNQGLIKIDRKRYRFRNYSVRYGEVKLDNNYIRALTANDSSIWLGFKKGSTTRLTYDSKKKTFIHKQIFKTIGYKGESLFKPTINTCLVTQAGDVWSGGLEGLFKLNKTRGVFEIQTLRSEPKTPLIPLEVWSLCEDHKGRIWIGGKHFGLWLMDKDGISRSIPIDAPKNISIWQIFSSPNGIIWLGTNQGLYRVFEQADSEFQISRIKGLEEINIWDIKTDGNGLYFLASTDHGFFIYDENTAEIELYTTNEGLPSNSVCGVEPDSFGNVWLSTANGLCALNYSTGKINSFYKEDGLISNDFNFSVNDQTPNGQLFFGTKNGIVTFPPGLEVNAVPPLVNLVVSSFKVNGLEMTDSLHNVKRPTFPYNHNTLDFGFSLLEFSRPAKHLYQYKLEPFDQKWKKTDGHFPLATYTNLPPAEYTFKLRASLNGTNWYDHKGLSFSISPAFWQRAWFFPSLFIGGLLLLSGVLYSLLKSQFKKEQQKGEIEKRMANLELKALQAQMNPHFIFNAIHSVQHYMLKDNLIAANDYLTRFARLMRFFLEASINKRVRLDEEINMLELYIELEALRFDSSFNFDINYPPDLRDGILEIPSMIIQPFVENAIQHGLAPMEEKGYLLVEVKMLEDKLMITVDDNGIGREKAKELKDTLNQERPSRGMQLIKERMEVYNASGEEHIEIEVIDKQDSYAKPSGTRVVINLTYKD